MMFNLRIHTDTMSAGALGAGGVFYSQRASGPHYRWRLDEKGLGQWRYTRIHPSEWHPKVLFHVNEKDMPAALQAMLVDHYMW